LIYNDAARYIEAHASADVILRKESAVVRYKLARDYHGATFRSAHRSQEDKGF